MPSPMTLPRHLAEPPAVPRPSRLVLLDRYPAWRWAGPLAVTVLAAVLRFAWLGHPAVLMFDETYYVKDAWTILHLGYEGIWRSGVTDASFASGHVNAFTSAPEYVAHPPLGKWLIAIGLAVFGATDPVGWRFSVAVAGTLAVLLLTLLATTLFRSTTLGVLAGGLFAIDGQAIVLSRVSLLDNFVLLFALLGFGAVLLDARQRDRRLTAWLDRAADPAGRGPVLAWRPWLIAAGIAFGLTSGVKWSGIYFLAAFALYAVVAEGIARRRAGIADWVPATVLRTAPIAFLSMVVPAVGAYLACFTGWFVTSGGYNRHWIAEGGQRWTGLLAWVPDVLQNLWHWHASIYAFHTGLSVSHPYATPAILWPLLARPTQMYYRGSGAGQNGCQYGYCSEIVWSIANPVLWWAAVAATLYLVYRLVRFRGAPRDALLLTGVAAGYLPWLLYPTRTMFQFYSIAFEPYLLLALVAVIGSLTGLVGEPPPRVRVDITRRLTVVFVVLVALVSAFFYPMWTGEQTPFWFWQLHVWLRSWV